MKKVVIFYKSYRKYGGQERVIWNFTHYLAQQGYSVEMYAMKIKNSPEHKNIKVNKVKIPNLGVGLRTLFFAVYAYFKVRNITDGVVFGFGKTFHQDIYRADGGVHKYYFKRAKLKYRSKFGRFFYILKKFLSISHWVNIWIENRTYSDKRLEKIVVPSEFVKMQIKTVFNEVDENKIEIIRNDVTVERFNYENRKAVGQSIRDRLGLKSSDTVFCFVSTNHRLKGLEYLLEACSLLKKRGYKFSLIVAGNGNSLYFKKIIKKLGLSENVKCLGVVKDVENIYYASDFLIYPTLFDTFGLVVLEAMACGAVVFCSKYAGASEIIDDSNFIIKDPTDTTEIADKMMYAIDNKNLWDVWSQKAHKTAGQYSTNTSNVKLLQAVEKLTANKH